MNARFTRSRVVCAMLVLAGVAWCVHAGEPVHPSASPSLKAASGSMAAVDAQGFIRRWLVREPVSVNGRLVEGAIEELLRDGLGPDVSAALPRNGQQVQVGEARLTWHAMDSNRYNFNLHHFATALSKPTSNVLFNIAAVVDAPAEMAGVRLAIGSNAASVWWVNGQRVISLYNDRQSVIDDGVSPRLTLRKGRNIIHAVIVNAGGATDFCARFLDAEDRPINGLKVSTLEGER